MDEREIRQNGRPHGNVDRVEPPYPDAPLASRGLTDDELFGESEDAYAELARATREPGALSGVRLWMTWPGSPEIADANARAVVEYAERLGFSALDLQVAEAE
jgi:hypothetical protein